MRASPDSKIEMSSGGHPNLRWTKGKFDGVEIWKDSGTGLVKLDRDMRPDYIDKTNLPANGTAAVWRYKMIYLMNDEVDHLIAPHGCSAVGGQVGFVNEQMKTREAECSAQGSRVFVLW